MHDDVFARERFTRSLERSRERRQAARRRRQRIFQRRTLAAVLAASMALGGGAALAAGAAQGPAHHTGQGVLLRLGSSGPSVSAVQRALGIPADGAFGPRTERAVKRYQRAHGLLVDGIVGPQTAGALGISLRPAGVGAAAGRPTGAPSGLLERIARCESGGNPRAISPGGVYRGKYQFSRATWRSLGGVGDPAAAPEAVQDAMAAKLLARAGRSAWPNCG